MKLFKRVLIFIGLKIAEIVGVVAVVAAAVGFIYWLACLGDTTKVWLLFLGYYFSYTLITIFALIMTIGIVAVFCTWIKDNWERAGRLANK